NDLDFDPANFIFEDNGNPVVTTSPDLTLIKFAPVKILVHGDQPTFIIIGRADNDNEWYIEPLHKAQIPLSSAVAIYSFRESRDSDKRIFKKIGEGEVRLEDGKYILKTMDDVTELDKVIYACETKAFDVKEVGRVIEGPAMDPRLSLAAALYAISELRRLGVPTALITSCDEEGLDRWAKLLSVTVDRWCTLDDIILESDLYDGSNLIGIDKIPAGSYVTSALISGLLSFGKGGVNSDLAKLAIEMTGDMNERGIDIVESTKAYCSRSCEHGIEEDAYYNILAGPMGNVGEAGDSLGICHVGIERATLKQLKNMVKSIIYYVIVMTEIVHDYSARRKYITLT
ncbi:TPA: hypothetical protein HA317_02370, partial [Candidatus Woesearchaeota archaeon]|nr:hypothetical protein [Candidatus Woesearchaeota archaeon]